MASKAKTANTRTRTKTAPATATKSNRSHAKTTSLSDSAGIEAPSRTLTRTPLTNRSNSPERVPSRTANSQKALSKTSSYAAVPDDTDREPITAYLRIRPQIGDDPSEDTDSSPYLESLSNTSVRMSDPSSSSFHSRMSTISPSSIYTFSHIFGPSSQQPEFFTKTTLPLVRDVLEGQSGLLFTYGVTNSGKTYTVQGGTQEGSAGILPRTLDVIFNSIEGLQGDGRYVPVRLQGIEAAGNTFLSAPSTPNTHARPKHSLASLLDASDAPLSDLDTDPTTLKLDRNYEYTVWLSYVEVYNEKVYDLFDSVDDHSGSSVPTAPPSPASRSVVPRPTSTFLNTSLPSSHSPKPLLLSRKALQVRPCPASDSDAGDVQGKYISGMRQLRVTSAAQAKALLRVGQLHRRVFGTLANSQSSRSHALVTIKILRVHRGEKNDPTSIQTSRLTLVDLAGSERNRNTHTTGERLREAGNINKSLMVLGQCMETMRSNQRIIGRALASSVSNAESRLDTRDVKKNLAVVPFRHSKLTEILMDYFVGEGHVVMIVNVNPYDTGYDENSHVMKFAALAREVCTTVPTAVSRIAPPVITKSNSQGSDAGHRRKVTISFGGPLHQGNEAELEVLEEDEEPGEVDDDEPINPLVDALFDEVEALRMQLFEAEMRSAIVEAETREEVVQEMEERMRSMEKMYTRRLAEQIEENEAKMDAKIGLIQRAQSSHRSSNPTFDSDDEEDLEDIAEADEVESDLEDSQEVDEDTTSFESALSPSPSPLATKKATRHNQVTASGSTGSAESTANAPLALSSSQNPHVMATPHSRPSGQHVLVPPTPVFAFGPKTTGLKTTASKSSIGSESLTSVLEKAKALSLDEDRDDDSNDSITIIPNKATKQPGEPKKKKRIIGKQAEAARTPVMESEDTGRPLRRSLRHH